MSWSVQGVGKSDKVKAHIMQQFDGYKCAEPEESVRLAAKALIGAALDAQIPAVVVKVQASGSMSTQYSGSSAPTGVSNYLQITVEPVSGFIE